jgi:hypothetical protein
MLAYMTIPGSAGFESTVPFEAKETTLWWQEKGLSYTATGYGRKIPTRYMVRIQGRWRRVYACQISNAGTCYIGKPGAWEYIVQDIVKGS